ncbi:MULTISPECIES: hypothetical protein [Sphingobacterium]|uniref:Holin-X, holin superfamily III n=1 Tax=Sphingobacterium cellulitidis TaxID=1768011 RepID=A0A8H9KW98_9SPHI|nr:MULTISPECIES: hypothetical protein [Sphingobacterium]MBA8985374.1 ABC-type multidrug transport system fused ATPase/permease subunit [Sphingobacterium soli]WFB63796.1 hypothetical protein PZ892_00995 [Sphingobacterium sp. WM]GGE10144.1 hypothetical protein GCM10011516_04850 [Sphingobacterium soli]
MEEQKFSFSEVFDKSKEYIETQIELAKLKALSRSSRIAGSLIVDGSKVLLALLIVFFISLALGFYLGELLGSYSLGFLATGGIFFVILLLIRIFEPRLEAKFMNMTIKRIMSKWDADDHDVEVEEIKEEVRDAEERVEEELKEEKERV